MGVQITGKGSGKGYANSQ